MVALLRQKTVFTAKKPTGEYGYEPQRPPEGAIPIAGQVSQNTSDDINELLHKYGKSLPSSWKVRISGRTRCTARVQAGRQQ